MVRLNIKTYTGRQFVINYNETNEQPELTIGGLKEKIAAQEEIPEWKQTLIFDGVKLLKDDAPLDDYGDLMTNDTLVWLQINTNLKKPPAAWREKQMRSVRKPAHLPAKPIPMEKDTWLITGGADRRLYVRRIAGVTPKIDGTEVKLFDTYRIMDGHNHEITHIGCAGDGQRVVSASKNELILWDIPTGKLVRRITGHAAPINSLSVSGDVFLTGAGAHDATRGELKLWDIVPESKRFCECVKDFKGIPTRVVCCALAPNNRACKLVVAAQDRDFEGKNLVKVYHKKTGTVVSTLDGHTNAVTCVDLAQNGRLVVTGSMDCLCKLWNAMTAEILCTFSGHQDWVTCITFTPDFKNFLSGSRDHSVKMWSAKARGFSTCTKQFFGHRDLVSQCKISGEGSWVATSSYDSTIKMWREFDGHLDRTIDGGSRAWGTVVAMCGYGTEPVTLQLRMEEERRHEELERLNMENEDKSLKRYLSTVELHLHIKERLMKHMQDLLVKNFPVEVRQGGYEGDQYEIDIKIVDAKFNLVEPYIGATKLRKLVVTNTISPHAGKQGLVKGGPDKKKFYRVRFVGDRADHSFHPLSLFPQDVDARDKILKLVTADIDAMYETEEMREARKKLEKKRKKDEKKAKRRAKRHGNKKKHT